MKKILFVGSFFSGSTSNHRLNAVQKLDYTVASFNLNCIENIFFLFIDRVLIKFKYPTINSYFQNKKLLRLSYKLTPVIIWIDKGIYIYSKTLIKIKNRIEHIKFIHYSPDDIKNPSHQTKSYLSCVPFYDLHVTTKSYNVKELYDLGAKKVLFVNNAFAPEIHKPYELTNEEEEKYSADVSFIGGPEKERAGSINYLAQNGIKVAIWGNDWQKFLIKHKNLTIHKGWFADEEYSKIICASKINLAFLRKVNRDLQTTRTMEIPACGGFMLAERTKEHLELFKEDEEAVFFSNDEELKRKIEFYLSNDEERKRIAKNGFNRCKESGYDNLTMVKKVLDSIYENK